MPPEMTLSCHASSLALSSTSVSRCEIAVVRLSDLTWKRPAPSFPRLWTKRSQSSLQGVLVHCVWGASRSAAVAVAWLCTHHEPESPAQALERLRAVRPCVNPNVDFMRQVEVWYNAQNHQ